MNTNPLFEVARDYSGGVNSAMPELFAQAVCMLFGGKTEVQSDYVTWSLDNVGSWKIYGAKNVDEKTHIPLRVGIPVATIQETLAKWNTDTQKQFTIVIEGANHWRMIKFFHSTGFIGQVHLANRD